METLFIIIEYIGVASFAAAGAMIAIDKETDIIGVLILSLMTCFGGGIMRDVILTRGLPLFFTDMTYQIITAILTALLVFVFAALFKRRYVAEEAAVVRVNNVFDALGLGIFTATGMSVCSEYGPFVSIVLAMITAIGGGVIRDVMLSDIPFILRSKVYVVAVLVGAGAYHLVSSNFESESAGVHVLATVICVLTVFAIRICATVFRWDMPKAIIFSEMEKDGK